MRRRRAAFRQIDVTRLVKGALAGGLDPSKIRITLDDDGRPCLLPADGAAASTPAEEMERRMRDAFGA